MLITLRELKDNCDWEIDQLHKKYYELIMAVEQKHPNESRHETALRYIRERENSGDNVTKAGSNQE